MIKRFLSAIGFIFIALSACVKSSEFDALKSNCASNIEANSSFLEIEALFNGETIQIHEDLVLEGYVISSDKSGNFFNTLFLQDHPSFPTQALQIEIDFRKSHLFFEAGSKVLVKLKGLYLGKSSSVTKLGGTFSSFGNVSVGRLPTLKVQEHIFLACDQTESLEPILATISELDSITTNTLVKFEGLEIIDEELGVTFAEEGEETERFLQDCEENRIGLLTSGFSDFQAEILPEGNGTISGILQKDKNEYQLIVRDLNDIEFKNDRCPEVITEFTSTEVFISELADPNNNSGARFVELYNASSEPLDLNKWMLHRYTNDKTEISSTIDLSGFIIDSERTLVLSPNAAEFEAVYGFAPDLGVSTNSPADSNGDDNLALVDPFGTVIDVFGVVGEDGSGTNHEFEDGRALRNTNVTQGNPNYTFTEWTICNDSGDSGTTKQPKNAPEDFTPGARE